MSRISGSAGCPIGDGVQITRFQLGPRDARFTVHADDPTHVVDLELESFDASSLGEPGGMLVSIHKGEARLLGAAGCWTLPAGHMVYIPADRSYRLQASEPSKITLVKFTNGEPAWCHAGCWAIATPALSAEMLAFARRWDRSRDPDDQLANSFFVTMGALFSEWFDSKRRMWTPFGNAPEMDRAISYAREHMETVSISDTAAVIGMSERTLRRRFKDELGITWRDFINEIRMSEAMKLLRQGGTSVTDAAYSVGFSSLGAFTVAFSNHTGMTPSSFSRQHAQF